MDAEGLVKQGVALARAASVRGWINPAALQLVLSYYENEGAQSPLSPQEVLERGAQIGELLKSEDGSAVQKAIRYALMNTGVSGVLVASGAPEVGNSISPSKTSSADMIVGQEDRKRNNSEPVIQIRTHCRFSIDRILFSFK